jgi:hypothetical protein
MGTMREEVVVEMGGDASGIERAIGVGKSSFNSYLDWVKTQEGQYSNWWNSELKKREELEVASSVRAASRAIQARKLLRERETVRTAAAAAEQATANTVIGAGSIPAGWIEQAAAKKAARELEMKAAAALKDAATGAHGSSAAMRELMVVTRELARGDLTRLPGSMSRLLGMIGLSSSGLLGVGLAAAEAGAILYEVYQTRKAMKEEEESNQRNDAGAKFMAGRLKGEIENFEKVGKISHETAAKYEKILSSPTLERNRVVQDALRKLHGPVTKHDVAEEARLDEEHNKKLAQYAREDMNAHERITMDLLKQHLLKDEMAKLDRTGVEFKKKQVELDDLQRDILEDQKKIAEEKAEAERKAAEEQRVYDEAKIHMKDIEQRERDKFMPTLDELAHHGSFTGQARGISRLERRIKRELERGDTGGADRDIATRNKIYDSLADRGVVAERADRREIKELTAKMQLHIAEIAQGKAAIRVIPALK